jgi:nucleotide sugar dehydrogenase
MIGIVGNGFVGNAVHQNLKDKDECKVFDVDPNRSPNTLNEVLSGDFIFVCLPTPMSINGKCDLSIIEDFFSNLPEQVEGIFVIKSTVPVGTTEKFAQKHKVIHNPEFLTAKNSVEDFKNSERNIIGGKREYCEKFAHYFSEMFPHIPNQIVTSIESETIKYFANSFLATKVAYFNKMYDFCQELGIDYDSVKTGVISDSRIGKSHTDVPGFDGDRGFGGTCFPKDINSLIHQMNIIGVDSSIFYEVWKYNQSIRSNINWTVS